VGERGGSKRNRQAKGVGWPKKPKAERVGKKRLHWRLLIGKKGRGFNITPPPITREGKKRDGTVGGCLDTNVEWDRRVRRAHEAGTGKKVLVNVEGGSRDETWGKAVASYAGGTKQEGKARVRNGDTAEPCLKV